ncbi:hypothetical protein LCGC14_1966870 [marine sediment metagenome]|uniref:Uncharacterized protein n=1 Tax=marine sediment metagenome TaxID=412755 RepID=A0A0F9G165_9ZZZZ
MLMVRVNVGKDKEGKSLEPIVGLLIDTHLMPMQGPPKAMIGEGGKLMQTPGQTGFQAFGVVAAGEGFIVGPLSSMTPMMQPDEEGDDEVKPDGGVAAAEEILS